MIQGNNQMLNQLNPPNDQQGGQNAPPGRPGNIDAGNPQRKKEKRFHGKYFIVIALSLIIFEFYVYMFHIVKIVQPSPNATTFLLKSLCGMGFSLLTILILWAYFVVMKTHPGQIPLYWGFYIGDDEYKRKRYCLICNAFKPERSHHCSICNVCVLNMDHHCPWVDNCIGFNNRKFFMQLLFYLEITNLFNAFTSIFFIIPRVYNFYKDPKGYNGKFELLICVANYIGLGIFTVIFGMFVKFHINLVLTNSTTIENLDKEHAEENKKFCLSKKQNWEQVFGNNRFLWLIPIVCEEGAPIGDGLIWQTNNLQNEMGMNEGTNNLN